MINMMSRRMRYPRTLLSDIYSVVCCCCVQKRDAVSAALRTRRDVLLSEARGYAELRAQRRAIYVERSMSIICERAVRSGDADARVMSCDDEFAPVTRLRSPITIFAR